MNLLFFILSLSDWLLQTGASLSFSKTMVDEPNLSKRIYPLR